MQDEKIIVATDNPSLLRTLDAAEVAGIKAAESRTARKIFLKIADRLKLSPADERREAKGGSPQKFWTREQIDIVAAEYAKNKPTVTLADRVRRIQKFSADAQHSVINIGKELIAAKDEIPHGDWAKWLEKNFKWNIRTAQRFIAIAERFGNTTTLSHLNASTLQAMLALPVGTEQEFIDEQAAADNPVENQSARQVQAAVKQFKAQKKISAPVIVGKPAQIDSPVIDVDAVIAPAAVVTKQFDSAEDSATVNHSAENDSASGIKPAATATEDSATIGKTDNVVRFQPSTLATLPRDIAPAADVQIDSERVNDIEPAQDSEPANGIDRDDTADNLAAVFKLILEINDADKLRRIRDFADARIAALEGKKIMPTGADA